MTLNKREKIYAIVAVSLLAFLLLYWAWPSGEDSLDVLRANRDKLLKSKDDYQKQLVRAKKITDRLVGMQRRALPTDSGAAKREYQNWLRNLANDRFKNVTSLIGTDPQPHRNVYLAFNFTINCQGSLEQLTQFLWYFYSAGHLHKIRSISITPMKDPSELDLVVAVEALSLPGSKQTDKLTTEKGNRLKLASLEAYKKIIVNRNLFVAYKPPKNRSGENERAAPPSKVDPLQFSFLTGIIEADGVPEALLFTRTTGEMLHVHEGEEFTIGKVKAKLNRIGNSDIDIEIDGQTHTVGLGNNLKM